ncbi:DUF2865 domain-containing protein [Acuticoccus mangrovi]|uniref:DUF2865 domain-containing protein n=1 Tax=Acuticoccus mangrovi TaxID=2796142 RepID=A0A934ICN6_9HYPH|nr:DUF2865 domain-containing protein [Acuticoccus mangrovi]MBJ3774108.1 DUF2865 domain-containing protein [Acuticoccus mangrovi]
MRNAGGGNPRRIRELQRQVARACDDTRTASRQQQRRRTVAPPASGVIIHGTRPDNQLNDEARRGGFNIFSNIFGRRHPNEVETVSVDPREAVSSGSVERVDIDEQRLRRAAPSDDSDGSGRALRIGNARTVCVRLCDGFYFPINSQSHSSNFNEELAMCVGRCPGADVSLYAHDRDSPVETMRSTLTSERYVRLPTAFLYRKKRVADCGCQTQSVIASDMTADKALGFVGLSDEMAASKAAERAATTSGGYVRYKAVYDATGKPLAPSLTLRTPPSTRDDVQDDEVQTAALETSETTKLDDLPSAKPLPQGGEAIETVAAASTPPLRVREVGPQFFSRGYGLDEPRPSHAPLVRPTYTSPAITIVPLTNLAKPSAPRAAHDPAKIRLGDESRTSQLETVDQTGG